MESKSLSASDFVHLHNHTQYSLLDGLTRVGPLMDFVQLQGMTHVAMTDHGTLSGAVEFYSEALARGINPIIGIETYVASRKHTDKDPSKDKARYHLILLAMNNQGYQNLMRLSTIANLDGFYYHPRVDHELLERYNEGLIVLSGCMSGEIGDALKQGQYEKAKEIALWYKKVFPDRYYLEVQDHGHPDNPLHSKEQNEINDLVLKLAHDLKIPAVLTCDAHYLHHEDQDAHEILLCVGTGSFLSDEKRMSLKEFPLHVAEPSELIERWGDDYPDLITNSKKIADRCDITLDLGKILIPKFDVPKGKTEKTFLRELVFKGLAWRYGGVSQDKLVSLTQAEAKNSVNKEILDRAEYELGVIDKMGFNGYFLIIQDFINWGKRQGIVFGPGRGSAAGSIIAYSLNITELDPLKYDLLFERFLNPDRISMPDIDIDIQDTRRDEVIKYCVEKYGSDRVANIVTFGRMFARNAVRDVARVLQVPYADADRLAKMIPPPVQGRHIPLEQSLKDDNDLRQEYESNEISKRVLDQAVVLEGTIRSHGVHAAGVVIAPDEIVKFAPLEMAQKGVVATQYSMGPIEELGLLKMDFLGLSNLTIIKNALRIVRKVYGQDLDLATIPLDDNNAFELFRKGETTGVFQFESAGMKRYLKELQPTKFDDLIAMNALYRPGPMQWIEDFIARKHGKKKITYLHPAMEPALKSTYGVIVYQEQVMQISKEMCGFTGGQADTLRKGIGKKIPAVLAKFKTDFIEGAIKTVGADREAMEKFWKELEAFASYAFPKAHSSCYALIAYWTAYLKANYPSAFMAALMTSDYDDTDRLAIEISECKKMGISVLPPDVNESFLEFAVIPKTKQIRFGMNAIKNVGSATVEEIIAARKNTNFSSLEDFLSRVNPRLANRKALESLIKAGALERFGDRSVMLANIDAILAFSSRLHKEAASGQTDLFGNSSGKITKPQLVLDDSLQKSSPKEFLVWERELLGIYLSQHPLQAFELILAEKTLPIRKLKSEHDGKRVTVGGSVQEIREITTKKGQAMAFVRISDQNSDIELILFPSVFQQTVGIWDRDNVVMVKGKVNAKDKNGDTTEEVKVVVEDAREITPEQANAYKPTGKKIPTPKSIKQNPNPSRSIGSSLGVQERVYIRLDSSEDQDQLIGIKEKIDFYKGDTEVVLVLGRESDKQIIKLPMKLAANESSLSDLASLVGAENVKLH